MEIAAFVVAVLAVLAAGASAFYARGANSRADTANERAGEALDLQRRIDERAGEFTDVRWEIRVDSEWSGGRYTGVSFHNVGLTPARKVTFVIEVEGWAIADILEVDEVLPGHGTGFNSDAAAMWMEKNDDLEPQHPPFLVHWSSPLGNVMQRSYDGECLYERTSGGE